MLRTRTVVRAVVVLAAAGLALPPLSLALDESAMPPASSLPALPDGAHVGAEDMGCGSGGCWLELPVDAPAGMSGKELAAAVVPGSEACGFQGVLDLRRVCTGVTDVDAGAARFYVRYDRWIDS